MVWYDKWAIMAIAAGVGVGAYNWIRWPDVDATIVAYWVQAAGSVGALCAAIYIAGTESRARKKQASVVAKLTYVGMVFRLYNIQLAVGKASKKLAEKLNPDTRINYRSVVQLIDQAGMWRPDELIALVPLEHDVAIFLSTAGDRISHCRDLLSRADRNPKLNTFEMESKFNGEMSEILGNAHRLIVEASNRGRFLTNTFQVKTRD
ncbi:hypothetical protein FHI69_03040 [Janthinobacterium lividum]|uniref:Transmembrane protein n=1 Tax=Janthinobacterium lividum TaxID=29581 RepID=A0A5C4NV22_9BURK|nr:hypothetical protein [Janthinobacterium lividum]TNC78283.1 hypothetical protein FHI69_03040 [Janthinobacterium lividum]